MQKLPKVFCKKGGLINLAKFTGKHLRQSIPFDKAAVDNYSTEPQKLKYFRVSIKKFFKAACLWNTSMQLLSIGLIFISKKFLPKKMY